MASIQIAVEGDVVDLLGSSPEQVERRALEMIVLGLYRQHDISAGRAAEILDQDEFAFIRWAGRLGVPYFDTTPEDWEQQLRVIQQE